MATLPVYLPPLLLGLLLVPATEALGQVSGSTASASNAAVRNAELDAQSRNANEAAMVAQVEAIVATGRVRRTGAMSAYHSMKLQTSVRHVCNAACYEYEDISASANAPAYSGAAHSNQTAPGPRTALAPMSDAMTTATTIANSGGSSKDALIGGAVVGLFSLFGSGQASTPAPAVDYAAIERQRVAEQQRQVELEAALQQKAQQEAEARRKELLNLQHQREQSQLLRQSIAGDPITQTSPAGVELLDQLFGDESPSISTNALAKDLFGSAPPPKSPIQAAADELFGNSDSFSSVVASLKRAGTLDEFGQGKWSAWTPALAGSEVYVRTKIVMTDTIRKEFRWAIEYHNRSQRPAEVQTVFPGRVPGNTLRLRAQQISSTGGGAEQTSTTASGLSFKSVVSFE